jgi:NAD(P)-dependent dehydrogenase (short-subunit alcohol dehydrogenase family)
MSERTDEGFLAAIERAGGTALACRADVAEEDRACDAVRTVEAALGPIDALVNNAAIGARSARSGSPRSKTGGELRK